MEIIRLLDSKGDRVLDSISAEYEDSFCLETFSDLIASHANVGRSFIIARVQTWDHKLPESKFFSYYNAYNLNKILFQTQVFFDKKLIHRLNVLNPLSNTDIIGNVQYFMVTKSTQPRTMSTTTSLRVSSSTNNPTRSQEENASTKSIAPSSMFIRTAKPTSTKPTLTVSTKTNPSSPPTSDFPPPSPSVQKIESDEPASWTLTSPSVSTIPEEDEPTPDAIKNPNNTPAYSPHTPPPAPTNILTTLTHRFSFLTAPKIPIASKQNHDLESNHPSLTIKALISPSHLHPQMSLPTAPPTRVTIPDGTVTRFAQPLVSPADTVPKTDKSRRRSLSYLNAVNAMGGVEQRAGFEEWVKMVREETRSLDGAGEDEDYDFVNPFGSPKKMSASTGGRNDEEEVGEGQVVTYDALLFATDDDFLENSKIRTLFRQNAVAPEDAKLFEMTPVTADLPASPQGSARTEEEDEGSACEWCFPNEVELRRMGPVSRFVHRYKCLLVLAVFVGVIALL
ncbi:hypothetical protein HDU98_006990 [Podochytrium sp. JEL0797]|nr:hypothetical protein HDU98_006990 [Podochytrium sp. JEL0797]